MALWQSKHATAGGNTGLTNIVRFVFQFVRILASIYILLYVVPLIMLPAQFPSFYLSMNLLLLPFHRCFLLHIISV